MGSDVLQRCSRRRRSENTAGAWPQIERTNLVQQGENEFVITVTCALFSRMVLREPRSFVQVRQKNLSGLMSSDLIGPDQMKVMDRNSKNRS